MTATYDEQFTAILHSEELDLFASRDTAYQWHGGQWSPLYSYASTDCTVWDESHRMNLEGEILACMTTVDRHDQADELEALANLLRCIQALPVKNP